MTSIFDHAAEIAAWADAAKLDALTLDGPDGGLTIRRASNGTLDVSVATGDRTAGPATAQDEQRIVAPLAGVFLATHPLHDAPLVEPGGRVAAGQTIGLIRIGALLAPVLAPADAVLVDRLAETGALVGYGEPLFIVAAS